MVLGQEIDRFNKLTGVIIVSLKQLQLAIKGIIVADGGAGRACTPVCSTTRRPEIWTRAVSEPQTPRRLDPRLPQAHRDDERMAEEGNRTRTSRSGVLFPQGFMTECCRRTRGSISNPSTPSTLTSRCWTGREAEDIDAPAEDGVLIDGLFVDNARWNRERKYLTNRSLG